MKKVLILFFVLVLSACCAFAAKYKVNNSGVVKNNGNVVAPKIPATNPYNVYQSTQYVSSNVVKSTPVNTIELVMDYSASMSSWIGQAKKSMTSIMTQIPSQVGVGFRVFGQNDNNAKQNSEDALAKVKKIVKKNGKYHVETETATYLGHTTGFCSATSQLAPILVSNIDNILKGMEAAKLGSATPLVYALDRTVNKDFAGLDNVSPKKIVLITDGGENCGGDPCEFAKHLMATRSDVHIDVVLVAGSFDSLSCLANATGGKLYKVNNLKDFSTVLTQSMKSQPRNVNSNVNTNTNTKVPAQQYEFYEY